MKGIFPTHSPQSGSFGHGKGTEDQVTLFSGWNRLTTRWFGMFGGREHEGFFQGDTLYLNQYHITVDGKIPQHTFSAQTSPSEWSGVYLVPGTLEEGNLPEGHIPEGSLEMRISRSVLETWDESVLIRNYSTRARSVTVEFELKCVLGDIQFLEEMKLESLTRDPGVLPEVEWHGPYPTLRYERVFGPRRRAPTDEFHDLAQLFGSRIPKDGDPVTRALEIFSSAENPQALRFSLQVVPGEVSRLVLEIEMKPGSRFELRLRIRGITDGRKPRLKNFARRKPAPHRIATEGVRTRILTGNPTLSLMISQAEVDLESLALPLPFLPACEEEGEDVLPLIEAGVPRYMGIFSRDILTTAWQGSLLTPKYIEGAVGGLAHFKGRRNWPWRDEEPDRLPHEVRLNPLAELGQTNREIYYGDVVSTAFWLVTLLTGFHWTGNRELVRRHVGMIESCRRWIFNRLEQGNGFLYYEPASPDGNRHHAWKDSGDAIVDSLGRIAVSPMATSEVQGYCYLALLAAAELQLVLGHPGKALASLHEARELKKRFNEAFWIPEEAYFAVALDRHGRAIDSVTSNPGHCLGCGIVDRSKAAAVVARLMSPDLFSGWGIRTLSSSNPAFDPFSYHRGAVWPVENATIAGAFRLWGFQEQAEKVIDAQLATATLFPMMRLPEVMSGHERSEEYPVPGLYPNANLLQAWSVSAIFFFLVILLGIRPYAPLKTLMVNPHLPDWLPWIELHDLRVGNATVDLRFWRDSNGRSHWKVLGKQGILFVLEQEPELDLEAKLYRRVVRALRDAGKSVAA